MAEMEATTIIQLRSSAFLGGPEKQILGFARAMKGDGLRHVVASWAVPGRENPLLHAAEEAGISTCPLAIRRPFDPRDVLEFAHAIRRAKASLVVAHDYRADAVGLAAAKLCRVPLVIHARGWTAHTRRVRLYEALERKLFPLADLVVAVSEAKRRELLRLGVPPNRAITVHNCVEVAEASPSASAHQAWARRQLGLPTDVPVVGSVGRLSAEKGHQYFLEAAAILARDTRAVFVLVGDGPERDSLGRRIHALGLEGRVVMAGFRPNANQLIPAMDVVVLPSLSEGLPNAVLEAFSCARPVVASAVGGVPEVLEDGCTGLLVPPASPPHLAQAISAVLGSPDRARQMGLAGLSTVRDRFSFAANAPLLRAAYCSLIAH
jgi:glycosyltransferase involved in cell wall biosynthesis